MARDFILKGRIYCLLTGLHPELQYLLTLLFNRENQLSFDESEVHVVKAESCFSVLKIVNYDAELV